MTSRRGGWSLESDFEAVLLSRRTHLEPWLEAIEALGTLMPAQINRVTSSARGRLPPADHPSPRQYTATFWTEHVSRSRELAEQAGVSLPELYKSLWQYSRATDP